MVSICMIALQHTVTDDRVYHREALALSEKGYEVTIIARSGKLSGEKTDKINLITLDLKPPKSLIMAIMHGLKGNYAIYHAHDPLSLIIATIVKIFKPKSKLVWDVHEYYTDMISLTSTLKGKIFYIIFVKLLERLSIKLSSLIITSDSETLKYYKKILNVKKPVIAIRNYLTRHFLEKCLGDLKVAEKKVHNHITLVYEGSISKVRGLNFIILIALKLKKLKYENVRIILLGPLQVSRDNYLKYKNLLKKIDNIDYLGQLRHEAVPDILKNSHIGLILFKEHPKFNKNVPIKLFEYAACGLPIISTKINASCSLIIKNRWGICIDYGNVEAFFNAMKNILLNYRQYVLSCIRKARNYSWEKEKNKLIIAYKYISKML